MTTNHSNEYAARLKKLYDFGYDNNMEVTVSQRFDHATKADRFYFTIDNWNTGEKVEGSYPMAGATFSLNMSFVTVRIMDMIAA